ncbi:FAD:protein FMN transferase [Pseudolysinimonas sp.]|uniref:FAD:protein FMN transferase n=1 Tax=Pseudolysinimonas sp. TaxID=2680009 RepID=UPI003266542B
MGTVASLGALDDAPIPVRDVEAVFTAYDERFSLYRNDSELSRVASGELRLDDASTTLRDAYATAVEWRRLTGGAFTPNRPDGVIDLNGVVKALAIADAGTVLDRAGVTNWTLAVGGDVLTASRALPAGVDEPELIGIIDPDDRTALLTTVQLRGSRRAVATSGSAERGDHIWSRDGIADFVQATVVADDILTADVLATAIIAGGRTTLDDISDRWDVDVLTVDRAGALLATPGFRAAN